MRITAPAPAGRRAPALARTVIRDFKLNKWKYLLVLPAIVFFAVFAYKPMYGVLIAFKDYRPGLGIAGSPWVGLKHFREFFNDIYFVRVLRNTFSISLLSILFGFPAPILLALFLNEIKTPLFKRSIQTITYMPYFIATVVVCGLIKAYCQTNGVFNDLAVILGGVRTNFLVQSKYFYLIFVGSGIWQTIGWDSIIYLAALTSIDQEQYEAARIDGAGRFRQMLSVTLPGLLPTITILFILRMGGVLNVGFEKILLLYQPTTYNVADVIATYTYRKGIVETSYSYSTAVGLFNSTVNIAFLLAANRLSRKIGETSLF